MSKYLVSFGDSDKYEVDFPGKLDEFKNSDIVKGLKDKVTSFLKEKFPAGNFEDIVPLNIEEADGKDYPKLDMSKISDLLKNAVTQIGVEKFTDKLNLNAPFDKLGL
ncbi:MAG: hypothetical protein J1E16_01730 [Muribaculaceae bacterium]|nr:hypothetical protein [Muribaculaceae bacterium]